MNSRKNHCIGHALENAKCPAFLGAGEHEPVPPCLLLYEDNHKWNRTPQSSQSQRGGAVPGPGSLECGAREELPAAATHDTIRHPCASSETRKLDTFQGFTFKLLGPLEASSSSTETIKHLEHLKQNITSWQTTASSVLNTSRSSLPKFLQWAFQEFIQDLLLLLPSLGWVPDSSCEKHPICGTCACASLASLSATENAKTCEVEGSKT